MEVIRWTLAFGLLVSNIAVWRGVYLENDKFPEPVKDHGWRLLLCGLAAEAVFGFLIFAADTTISVKQKGEIERLRASNLALERLLAPRRLMPEQQADIGKSLKWFFRKRVVVESYGLDIEAKVLGRQIVQALKNADINAFDFLSTRLPSGSTTEGIYVSGRDSDFVKELIASLKVTGLDASDVDQTGEGSGDKIVIHAGRVPPSDVDAAVFVGVKPIKE